MTLGDIELNGWLKKQVVSSRQKLMPYEPSVYFLVFFHFVVIKINSDRLSEKDNPFHSDGLSHTYWYNKYGIVHFVF